MRDVVSMLFIFRVFVVVFALNKIFIPLLLCSQLGNDDVSVEESKIADCVVAVKTPPKVDHSYVTPTKEKSQKSKICTLVVNDENLGSFCIEELPNKSEFDIRVTSDLSNVRLSSLGFFCDLLEEVDLKKTLVEIALVNGSSRKFNIIFPTLKIIYDRHASNGEVITIIYSTTSDSQRAYKQLLTLTDSSPLAHKDLTSTVGCNPIGITSPGNTKAAHKSCEVRNIGEFAQMMSRFVIKKEIEEREEGFVWNTEKYGAPDFGIVSSNNIAEISLADEDILLWLESIKNKDEIKLISLSQAGINDNDIGSIVEELTKFTHLAILDLSFNPLTLECVESILQLLSAENIKFINVTNTDLMVEYRHSDNNLIDHLIRSHREEFFYKIIWYGSDEKVIRSDFYQLLEGLSNRDEFIDSHITYAHIDKLLGDIREHSKLKSLSSGLTEEI